MKTIATFVTAVLLASLLQGCAVNVVTINDSGFRADDNSQNGTIVQGNSTPNGIAL